MVSSIYNFNLDDWKTHSASVGQKAFRAKQIWDGLYKNLYSSMREFTNLPKNLSGNLEKNFTFSSLSEVDSLTSSDNETEKKLFRLLDGKLIETVLMKYAKRRTLCISSQAGCAMGCTFCATGKLGLLRNLSPGEIIEQVLFFQRLLRADNDHLTNIVVMGMGEPFHNYDSVLKALHILNHKDGFNFGARRITVSTVGLVPSIEEFALEPAQFNLAISLHAVDDDLRTSMLPINKKYDINTLLNACKSYISKTNRRVTFEWALVNGVNDTPEQADKLARLLRGMLCHVNLIPLNPIEDFSGTRSEPKRVQDFHSILEKNGIPSSIRVRRGIDIQAGCGQLAGKHA